MASSAVKITIHYCNLCRWMLRSAWMQQELLTTFDGQLSEVSLKPGEGGVFQVWVNDQCVWDRVKEDGFPDIKQLKQRVRDVIDPERSLGHSDK